MFKYYCSGLIRKYINNSISINILKIVFEVFMMKLNISILNKSSHKFIIKGEPYIKAILRSDCVVLFKFKSMNMIKLMANEIRLDKWRFYWINSSVLQMIL